MSPRALLKQLVSQAFRCRATVRRLAEYLSAPSVWLCMSAGVHLLAAREGAAGGPARSWPLDIRTQGRPGAPGAAVRRGGGALARECRRGAPRLAPCAPSRSDPALKRRVCVRVCVRSSFAPATLVARASVSTSSGAYAGTGHAAYRPVNTRPSPEPLRVLAVPSAARRTAVSVSKLDVYARSERAVRVPAACAGAPRALPERARRRRAAER